MKLYALSDIHGRTFSLQQFIDLGFDLDNPQHHIVFLGDYFDRYDDNYGVYLELKRIQELLQDRCHLIVGNHDGYMIEFIDYMLKNNAVGEPLQWDEDLMTRWNRNGAETTLKQCFFLDENASLYNEAVKSRLLEFQKFTETLVPYVALGDLIFTHAGINEAMETDYWTREMIHEPNPFPKKRIVLGHSPFRYCKTFDHLKLVVGPSHIGQMVINKNLHQGVMIIDNGEGNNIVCFDTKAPRKQPQYYGEVQ